MSYRRPFVLASCQNDSDEDCALYFRWLHIARDLHTCMQAASVLYSCACQSVFPAVGSGSHVQILS
jgi:hypothetical protein